MRKEEEEEWHYLMYRIIREEILSLLIGIMIYALDSITDPAYPLVIVLLTPIRLPITL